MAGYNLLEPDLMPPCPLPNSGRNCLLVPPLWAVVTIDHYCVVWSVIKAVVVLITWSPLFCVQTTNWYKKVFWGTWWYPLIQNRNWIRVKSCANAKPLILCFGASPLVVLILQVPTIKNHRSCFWLECNSALRSVTLQTASELTQRDQSDTNINIMLSMEMFGIVWD